MSHTSDFIIENNILTKYIGPGGDIAIPAGVTEIGTLAFFRHRAVIRSVTIPDGVRGDRTQRFLGLQKSCCGDDSGRCNDNRRGCFFAMLRTESRCASGKCNQNRKRCFLWVPQSFDSGDSRDSCDNRKECFFRLQWPKNGCNPGGCKSNRNVFILLLQKS